MKAPTYMVSTQDQGNRNLSIGSLEKQEAWLEQEAR